MYRADSHTFNQRDGGWGGRCAERNWDQNAFSSKTAVIFHKEGVTAKRNSFTYLTLILLVLK